MILVYADGRREAVPLDNEPDGATTFALYAGQWPREPFARFRRQEDGAWHEIPRPTQ